MIKKTTIIAPIVKDNPSLEPFEISETECQILEKYRLSGSKIQQAVRIILNLDHYPQSE